MPSPRRKLALWVAIAAASGVWIAQLAGWLEPIELAFYDAQLRRASRGPLAELPATLVLIGEGDIRRFNYPIHDTTLSRLIETLLEGEPRAVGIDIYRDLPVPRPAHGGRLAGSVPSTSPAYRALGQVVAANPRVVMISKLGDAASQGIPRPAFLSNNDQVGINDILVDAGGIVRRHLLYAWNDEALFHSFALQLALLYLKADAITPGGGSYENFTLGPTPIPALTSDSGPYVGLDDAGHQFLLDYRWGQRPIPAFSLGDALDGRIPRAAVSDRIVLVGMGSASTKDDFYTPLSTGKNLTATLHGVALHAHAADQLIRFARGESQPLRAGGSAAGMLLTLLFGLGGAVLGLWNRSAWLQALGLALGLGLLGALAVTLFRMGWWLPVLPPALAASAAAGAVVAAVSVLERAERRQLAGLFSRFQGPAVAEDIWQRRQEFLGERGRPLVRSVTLTALMSDLEGYTAASEKMEPVDLMDWVNEYMNAMAQLVEEYGGVVDDYAGDGIKANFGFPVPSTSEAEIDADAHAAVRCALAMGERMEVLNESWRRRDLPTGRCRVGLFTGPAVVGCIGGDRSLKYTSVGDTINTAARLEGFGKDDFLSEASGAAWRILIGEDTHRRIQDRFETSSIGAHPLKGKEAPVPIYRVFGAQS